MASKTISINLPEQSMSIDTFKNTMGIFPIKRVFLGKSEAIVEFLRNKDFEAFQFTNANGKIPNLGGALYQKVDQNFKWQFPKDQTYSIHQLQDNRDDIEETETDSQKNNSPKQEEIDQLSIKQRSQSDIQEELRKIAAKRLQNMQQALRQERIKQQQYRKSLRLSQQKDRLTESQQSSQQQENAAKEEDGFSKLKREILQLVREPSVQKLKRSDSLISFTIVMAAILMGLLIIFN